MTRAAARLPALLAAAGALTCCSAPPRPGEAPTTTTTAAPRPLSPDEAALAAGALANDLDRGNARFRATVPYGRDVTVRYDGAVDWRALAGRATVTSSAADGTPGRAAEVAWTATEVDEALPGLHEAMAQLGQPAVRFASRAPQPATVPGDRVLAALSGLAAARRDDPALLQQRADARFLRHDAVDGTAVDVVALGARLRLWIATGDGLLRRVEIALDGASGPMVVDLSAHGEAVVARPARAEVVAASAIPQLYASLTRPAGPARPSTSTSGAGSAGPATTA
jgi:hypothetical protein